MFVVECPSIPGCVSQGKTEQEAIENIKDTIIIALKYEPNEVCLLLLVHVK
jgi:predicted RNase H-like HicB family nuclease